jgi:predicted metal-dependent phosphoesterase TrpH
VSYADLHMHSRWSDGEWPPRKLVRAAAIARLSAISVTDHDETAGLPEAVAAGAEFGVEVLAGVEISTFDGEDRHMLGYGFDPEDERLLEMNRRAREDRLARAGRIVSRLEELGFSISLDGVLAEARGTVVGRPHVARALVRSGQVKTFREAFDEYLGDGRPACVAKQRLEPAAAVRAIHDAGGAAVFAHPGTNGGPEQVDALLDTGIDGVEVRHPLHGEKLEAALHEHAQANRLLRTGGTDFHGPRWGGIAVGTIAIPRSWWDQLLERVNERRSAAGLYRLEAGRKV